jgi:SAM-dependent methyltransferase
MSGLAGAFTRVPTTPWSVWKFNWLANHKIIAAVRRAGRHARGTLLDVGCGTRAFERYLTPHVERYLGVDLPTSPYLGGRGPDAYARGEALPFRDASVDTVLGLSIMTYFPEPLRMLEEAHRALKPGGVLLLEFTQMAPLHDEPHDYLRFTRYGAAWLLERAGFEPIEFIPIGGLWARVGLSAIAALNRVNRGPLRLLTELPVRALYVVLQLVFELLDRLFFSPREALSHLVVARRGEARRVAGG